MQELLAAQRRDDLSKRLQSGSARVTVQRRRAEVVSKLGGVDGAGRAGDELREALFQAGHRRYGERAYECAFTRADGVWDRE